MMHAMTDCTATGTIRIGDHDIVLVCNLDPHDEEQQHHDVVHGDWTSTPEE